jgi:uncharacterized protein YggT (Ycf19 family)
MGALSPFIRAFLIVLQFIEWLVLIWVVISWILFFASQTSFRWRYKAAFNILNQLNDIFSRMTYPFLKPFRRLLPPHKTAGIDWSPLLLLLAIFIIRELTVYAYGLILRP